MLFMHKELWLILPLLWAGQIKANVQCWVNGSGNLNFDRVRYTTPTTSSTALNYACQTPWDAAQSTYYVRFCHFIEEDPAMPGIAPRYLQHWGMSKMKYDTYSDAAHTQVLGPIQGLYPISSWVRAERHNAQLQGTFTIYGQVPAQQDALRAGSYESHFMGGRMRWRWSRELTSLPNEQSCRLGIGGDGGGEVNYYLNVTASAEEACFIQSASTLDFGDNTHNFVNPINSQGTISIRCPLETNWILSLDQGLHRQGGTRNMIHSQGNSIAYQLFRDAARTQPWGSIGEGMIVSGTGQGFNNAIQIPVYGRVQVQPINRSGEYTDTVTVTLTY